MRSFFVFSVVALLMSQCFVGAFSAKSKPWSPSPKIQAPKLDVCPECVDLMDQFINQLLNAILNGGVIGSCGALCSAVPNQALSVVCDLICDYVGIEAFIDAINSTDPDPIWVCQEIDICPIVNGGKVVITSAGAQPPKGPQGTTFNIGMTYQVVNATGPGGLDIAIFPPADEPMSDFEFSEGQTAGTYSVSWQLQAEPSEGESFSPGIYAVMLAVCEGDCTTIHNWGGVYASVAFNFTITP
jgi:hypothetical protein